MSTGPGQRHVSQLEACQSWLKEHYLLLASWRSPHPQSITPREVSDFFNTNQEFNAFLSVSGKSSSLPKYITCLKETPRPEGCCGVNTSSLASCLHTSGHSPTVVMRFEFSLLVQLLTVVSVSAVAVKPLAKLAALEKRAQPTCSHVRVHVVELILSALRASSFCSSFLHISTVTVQCKFSKQLQDYETTPLK